MTTPPTTTTTTTPTPTTPKRYALPEQCLLPMSEKDIKVGQDMLKEEFVTKNPEWVKELELMLKMKQKAEIQALSSFGFQFVTQVYLPRKLQAGDWI
jgi:meiotic recombination protein SPO11